MIVPDVVLGQILTASGKLIFPLALRVEDIDLEDIAWGLANTCRYASQLKVFYSVAQHSVLGAQFIAQTLPSLELEFFLHDAPEAYLGDVPTPLKRLPEFAPYREGEKNASSIIRQRYGLPLAETREVHDIDKLIRHNERRDLTGRPIDGIRECPLPIKITPWSPLESYVRFRVGITPLLRPEDLPESWRGPCPAVDLA